MLAVGEEVRRDNTLSGPSKVFITSAYEDKDPIELFRAYARMDRMKVHQVVDAPEEADIILFVENSRFHNDYFFKRLKAHPFVKKYPEKTFMFNPHDVPWAILRGLYANIPRDQFDEKYLASAPYFEIVNKYIHCDFTKDPEHLYSFYGAPSSGIRREIFKMKHHPRARILHSAQHMFFEKGEKPQLPQVQYAELITNSKFVLAPRGIGTSSIRLFEILQAGRVPVVLSDRYVFPKGMDWSKFAIIIPEKDVDSLPEILEREEASWPERSAAAKKAWDDHFAPQSVFHYFIENIRELKRHDHRMSTSLRIRNLYPYWKYAFRKIVIERVSPVLRPLIKKAKAKLSRARLERPNSLA